MPRRARIALSAESFGFGPVSKVCAVGQRLREIADVEVIAYGEGLVAEFFEHEGYEVQAPAAMTGAFDGAVVGLSPSLARKWRQLGVPVFYIDSLAFMWDTAYYRAELPEGVVSLYFCQDVFGSAAAVRANAAWLPVVPVQAIVRATAGPIRRGAGVVFNLGGCKNPFGEDATAAYSDLVGPIIAAAPADSVVLCSRAAAPILKLDVRCLPQHDAVSAFVTASVVYSSPGLTSLLEFATLGVRPILLPPQNLSQLYILHQLLRQLPSNEHLARLTALYPVGRFDDEATGVAYVAARNRDLSASLAHLDLYAAARREPESHRVELDLCGGFDGADQCARAIAARVDPT